MAKAGRSSATEVPVEQREERFMIIKWYLHGHEDTFSFCVENVSLKFFLFKIYTISSAARLAPLLLYKWYSSLQTRNIVDPRQRNLSHLRLLGQTVEVKVHPNGQIEEEAADESSLLFHPGIVLAVGNCTNLIIL
jgi:hypothetical protein